MPIVFPCPRCGATLTINFLKPGEKGNCRRCGNDFVVPEASAGSDGGATMPNIEKGTGMRGLVEARARDGDGSNVDHAFRVEVELSHARRALGVGDLHSAVTRLSTLLAWLNDNAAVIGEAVQLADRCIPALHECSVRVMEKRTSSEQNPLLSRWLEEMALSCMYAAWVYQSHSLNAKARPLLAMAVESNGLPIDALPFALYNLGVCSCDTDYEEAAVTAFSRVLDLNPADADARYNLGMSLARLGRRGEAIEVLEEFLRRHSASEDAIKVKAAVDKLHRESSPK